jgi:hypothetical protein
MTKSIDQHEGKKYQKVIRSCRNDERSIYVDVYEVLEAFGVTCPARQHAIKKLLMAGGRGKGSELADLIGAEAAVCRAIELQKRRDVVVGVDKAGKVEEVTATPVLPDREPAASAVRVEAPTPTEVGGLEVVHAPPYWSPVIVECGGREPAAFAKDTDPESARTGAAPVRAVEVGPDDRCRCDCGDECPLGKCGVEERCTAAELINANVPVVRSDTSRIEGSFTAPSVGIGKPATLPKSDWLTITDGDVKQAAAESGRTVDGIIATMEACVPADPDKITSVKNADGTVTATNLPPVRKVLVKEDITRHVSRMEARTNTAGEISIGGHVFEPDLKGVRGEVLHLMDKTCRYCGQKWFSFTGTLIPVCTGVKATTPAEHQAAVESKRWAAPLQEPKPAFTTAPTSMVPSGHVPVSEAEYGNVLEIKLGGHHFTPGGPVTESTTFERACVFCGMKWHASGYAEVGHFPKCKGPIQDDKSTDLVHSE